MKSRPPKKIESLFKFLLKNHGFNKEIQDGFLRQTLSSYETNEDRARLLLHKMVNTQSQPKLDPIRDFFMSVAKNRKSLSSFKSFSLFLANTSEKKKGGLFEALKAQPGWGPKTAALFVRNLALIEQNQVLRSKFWTDIDVLKSEEINLPVDAVILSIFSRFTKEDLDLKKSVPKTFEGINSYLKNDLHYSNEDILIWDDLWFWGFITQSSKSENRERAHGWNDAKYWSIFNAPQDNVSIRQIESRANEFLKIMEHKGK